MHKCHGWGFEPTLCLSETPEFEFGAFNRSAMTLLRYVLSYQNLHRAGVKITLPTQIQWCFLTPFDVNFDSLSVCDFCFLFAVDAYITT